MLTDSDDKATRPATQPTTDILEEYKTADGQIDWTIGGKFVLNTPRTQAVVGFARSQTVAMQDVTIIMQNPFAQVIVTSLSNDPLATAPRMLICATARAENTNEQFRPFRRGLVKLGTTPILLEPVSATITIKPHETKKPTVYVLDWYGRRSNQTLAVQPNPDGGWTFSLGDRPAGWFEVAFGEN